MRSNTIK